MTQSMSAEERLLEAIFEPEKAAERKRLYELFVQQERERKIKVNQRVGQHRRRARKDALPNTLTSSQYNKTLAYFGNACVLTGTTEKVEMEHAIPLSIGHGGTTFENCYPMSNKLNRAKSSANIFEWFESNRQRFDLSQERFDRLIEWLGKANGMTAEEYRNYVYWCHANPRSLEELQKASGREVV